MPACIVDDCETDKKSRVYDPIITCVDAVPKSRGVNYLVPILAGKNTFAAEDYKI